MAASYGTVTAQGLQSGQGYEKDIYFDDSAGNLVRWDGGTGAGAASPTYWKVPETVRLVDLVVVSATGQTKTQININNAPTGSIVRNSNHLSTVVARPVVGIIVTAGQELTMTQLA